MIKMRIPTIAQRATSTVWRIKDGTLIPLSSMSDAHLANAIAMLHRKLGPLVVEATNRALARERGDEDCWDPRDDFSPGVFGGD